MDFVSVAKVIEEAGSSEVSDGSKVKDFRDTT